MTKFTRLSVLTLAAGLFIASTGVTASPDKRAEPESHWVRTWTAAQVPAGAPFGVDPSPAGFTNQTVRELVHVTVGGQSVRVRLSNVFGEQALSVGHASVALPTAPTGAEIVPSSLKQLTFNGQTQVLIPKGQEVLSDPVQFNVASDSYLAISIHFPAATGPTTWHWTSFQTSYVSTPGDFVTASNSAAFTTQYDSWFMLSGVDVDARQNTRAVVALGDSITDGWNSTPNANHRWPDYLFKRLCPRPLTVLNSGLGGNQVATDGAAIGAPALGPSALSRLNRDALSQLGARTIIFQEGINDIHFGGTVPQIIAGYHQIATQAHSAGLRVLIATLTPSMGWPIGYTPEQEAMRQTVNDYIRTQHEFDGVLDFDAVLRDPADPQRLLPAYDSGDHLHPNDLGYQALANSISLDLL